MIIMTLGCCSNSKTGGFDDESGGNCAGRGGGMESGLEESEEGGVGQRDRVGTAEQSAGSGRNNGGEMSPSDILASALLGNFLLFDLILSAASRKSEEQRPKEQKPKASENKPVMNE
ncbi:uncharacterized protein A4U43_C04F25680 [Asparagus officinalis]|uniref:Uncharacterized protein n=1 Tax=Asparagus officinalis TaxID=4686 RepID=A0A5P1F8Z0_ASPOF|nr:uncharacterized protein A4U43_C04F25680 [Asparagus officinalis]